MVDMMAKEERTSVMKWKSLVFVSSSPHVVRNFTQNLSTFLEKLRLSVISLVIQLFTCTHSQIIRDTNSSIIFNPKSNEDEKHNYFNEAKLLVLPKVN